MYAPSRTVARARDLRRRMTLPEVIVWQQLRARALDGARFRRQHPIGPFILDFYCEAARLAVEVDGASHDGDEAAAYDARRTAWLEARAVRVHRVAARDVLERLDEVMEGIRLALLAGSVRQPPPPLRGPPPPMGEE